MRICVLAETKEPDIIVYNHIVSQVLEKICHVQNIELLDFTPTFTNKGQLIDQLVFTIDEVVSPMKPDIIFIIVDLDKNKLSEQRRVLQQELNRLENFSKEKVVVGIAKRNIEAWLLCDEFNLRDITGINTIPSISNAENISDPKSILKGYWRRSNDNRTKYYPKMLTNLSASIDIDKIFDKSVRFKDFVGEIKRVINFINSQA